MRLGLVRYLNARPLDYGLRQLADTLPDAGGLPPTLRDPFVRLAGLDGTLELVEEIPSRLYDMLMANELDAALISSVECLRNPDRLGYCSSVGVCAAEAAHSIVYLRRGDCSNSDAPAARVFADTGSRSSIALLQSLYFRDHGQLPEIVTAAPEQIPELLERDDAGLLIGDGALRFLAEHQQDRARFICTDLATWWRQRTGLPFVFALWAYPLHAASVAAVESLDALFEASLHAGEAAFDQIVAAADPELSRSLDARRYLSENLHYRLGLPERAALAEFRGALQAADLL